MVRVNLKVYRLHFFMYLSIIGNRYLSPPLNFKRLDRVFSSSPLRKYLTYVDPPNNSEHPVHNLIMMV